MFGHVEKMSKKILNAKTEYRYCGKPQLAFHERLGCVLPEWDFRRL